MSDSTSEPTYGARFAEAWATIQAYLSDLDRDELADLASSDRHATFALLAKQPELGSSSTLDGAAGLEPEELAIKLVQDRLEALASSTGDAWGGRFLAEWRSLGGPISAFRYSVIQELKQANREDALRTLARLMNLNVALKRRLSTESPSGAANLLHNELRHRQTATAAGLWPVFMVMASS
jgi:hypothetical protein